MALANDDRLSCIWVPESHSNREGFAGTRRAGDTTSREVGGLKVVSAPKVISRSSTPSHPVIPPQRQRP